MYWAQLIPGGTSEKPSVSSWPELAECFIAGFRNTTQAFLVDRSDRNPCVCLPLAPRRQIWRVRGKGPPGVSHPQAYLLLTFPPPPVPWGQPVPGAAQLCSSGAASARAQRPQPSGAMAPYGLDISPLPVAVPLGHLLQCWCLQAPLPSSEPA